MKKLLLSAATVLFSLFLYASAPTEKVLQSFNQSFKNVQEVKWYDVPDGCYEVQFTQDEVKARIKYDNEGNIMQTTRYYAAEQLPLFVRAKVNSRYAGKSIFGITEVTNEYSVTYHIVLFDKTHWYHIKSDNYGAMYLDKKFKKA